MAFWKKNIKERSSPKEVVNSKVCACLFILEAFFLSYIASGLVDLLLVFIFFFIPIFFVIAFMTITVVFEESFGFKKNIIQYNRPIKWDKKNIIIASLLISEILVAFFVKFFIIEAHDPVLDALRFMDSDLDYILGIISPSLSYDTFVIGIFLLFDLFLMRFIPLTKIPKWKWIYLLVFFITRIIIYYMDYIYLNWVFITLILQIIVLIIMLVDLDFDYLQAFVPDILYLITFYNTPLLIPFAIIMFCVYLGNYVFE